MDADYADTVCGILHRHFQAECHSSVPAADLATWLVCCALDAGWQAPGSEPIQVVFVHDHSCAALQHFQPSAWDGQIDGQAFTHPALGEFLLSAVADQHHATQGTAPLLQQCVQAILHDDKEHHLVLVADVAHLGDEWQHLLAEAKQGQATILSMEPTHIAHCTHATLGYSLMHAMGIKA